MGTTQIDVPSDLWLFEAVTGSGHRLSSRFSSAILLKLVLRVHFGSEGADFTSSMVALHLVVGSV